MYNVDQFNESEYIIYMGCNNTKEHEEYHNFMITAKDITKSKSVYQYQIAHFKILSVEKNIVPTAEEIQSIKIKKIMTSKRLADVCRAFNSIKSQYNELNDYETLVSLQHRLKNELEDKRQKCNQLLDEIKNFEKMKQGFKKLDLKKQNLKQKSQSLEMKLMKQDYMKRFSIQTANSPVLGGSRQHQQNKRFSQFIIDQRMENCDKCLEKLSSMMDVSFQYRVDANQAIIGKLNSQIKKLKQEKQSILYVQSIDIVDLNRQSSNSNILSEINNIKLQRIALAKENQALDISVKSK